MKTQIDNQKFMKKAIFKLMTIVMVVMTITSVCAITASASNAEVASTTQQEVVLAGDPALTTDTITGLSGLKNTLAKYKEPILAISGTIAIIAIILAGVCFMAGRSGKEMGKSWLLSIVLGVVIISSGTFLITLFQGKG